MGLTETEEVSDGSILAESQTHSDGDIKYINFAHSSDTIVDVDVDGDLRLWNVDCTPRSKGISLHEDRVTGLAILNERGFAISSSRDGTIAIVNIAAGELEGKLRLVPTSGSLFRGIYAIAISKDETLVSILADREISVYRVEDLISGLGSGKVGDPVSRIEIEGAGDSIAFGRRANILSTPATSKISTLPPWKESRHGV